MGRYETHYERGISVNCIAQESGSEWVMYHGDCCEVIKGLGDNTVDLCVHSPPFSSLYIYSDSMADMGNSANDDEFFQHYAYLIRELYRVTVPGRICVVHCKDLPKYKNRDGAAGLSDFPGMIIREYEAAGWTYHSRVTIWKDPVTEMQRTKSYGLLHRQLCRDSAASRQGMADYLVVFRKWDGRDSGDFEKPVRGPSQTVRFEEYIGEQGPGKTIEAAGDDDYLSKRSISPDTARDFSIQVWQRYASPVWFDINQMRVLNYRHARSPEDEKHICPLQLDVIERAVHLWSNCGDVVLSPFAGIGSEGVGAVSLERKFIGIELKESYYNQACEALRAAEAKSNYRPLFSFSEIESDKANSNKAAGI